MIQYQCDSCHERVPHGGPELPPHWTAVVAKVEWGDGEGAFGEQECDDILLCPVCRGGSSQALCARIEKMLADGFDSSPKARAGGTS